MPTPHVIADDRAALDSGLYARSFVDVYDAWYSALDDPADLVDAFAARMPDGGRVVELGSGTGRLAGPLAAHGFETTGVDISIDMLRRSTTTEQRVGADMTQLPIRTGSVDGVIIAYNTLCNLASVAAQRQCIAECSRALTVGGVLAIDMFVAAPANASHLIDVSTRSIQSPGVEPSPVVAMITRRDTDIGSGADLIDGVHIELHRTGTRVRPWRLCHQTPAALDDVASTLGLRLVAANSDWAGAPFTPEARRRVSWFERCADQSASP